MPTIIPALTDTELQEVKSQGERSVYEQCKKLSGQDLILFSLPWVRTNYVGGARDGETDFILFNERGFIVIEVKGGGISVERETDSWISTDRNQDTHVIKNPFKQASDYKYDVLNYLNAQNGWRDAGPRVNMGHAVIFPNLDDVTSFKHTSSPLEIIAGKEELSNLENWFSNLFDHWSENDDSTITPRRMEMLKKWFASKVTCLPLMRSQMADDEHKRIELTENQKNVLRGLASNPRVKITGGAGTGKTLLALHKAKILAEDGKKVLLLCYSNPLSEYMKDWVSREVGASEGSVEACTFHSFATSILEIPGCNRQRYISDAREELGDNSDRYEVIALAAYYASENHQFDYNAIIVDEAQDFKADWWLTVEPHLQDDNLYIFLDENQQIFGPGSDILPDGLTPYQLTDNCRNTKSIHSLAYSFLGENEIINDCKSHIDGSPVEFLEFDSLNIQADKIYHLIQRLINDEKLEPGMIAVLTPSRSFREYAKLLTDRPLPEGAEWQEKIINPTGVLIDTMARFKGLESMYIICWLNDSINPTHKEDARLLYTTCSRATSRLSICASPSTCELVRSYDG
jgi:hypothetical protein